MKRNKYIVFTAMGFELVGIIVSGVLFGQLIDEKFGTKGLGIVGFSMAGLAGWVFHIVVLAKKMENSKEE